MAMREFMGMPIVKLPKERLRYTRKGWYRFMFGFASGHVDFRTGKHVPDRHGCTMQEVWCGPFRSSSEAMTLDP